MSEQQQPMPIPPGGMTEVIRTREPIDSQTRQWQLSAFEIIEEVRHRLNGELPDDNPSNNFVKWIPISDPMANKQGINELCLLLSSILNKNIHLSYFTPEQISNFLIDYECSLTRKLEADSYRMGIRWQDVDSVFLMLANPVWAGVNRARFGGEKQFIEGTEQRRIISAETQPGQEKKGLFAGIPIIGR